jgi:hypothetical protein
MVNREKKRKEHVVAYSKLVTGHVPGETEGNHEIIRITDLRAEF